jgi:hypothetical protein
MTKRNLSGKELGILIFGVVIGGLFGIMGNIWASYFVEWYKSISPIQPPNWDFPFWSLSIGMIVFIALLIYWARRLLKQG